MASHRSLNRYEDIYTRELNTLRKAAEAGHELAPPAALFFCAQHRKPVPEWLTPLASATFCNHLNQRRPKKRGRSTGPLERCRQDMIDYMRWELVQDTRYQQKQKQSDLESLKEDFHPKYASYLLEAQKMAAWFGMGWLRAYECASMMLQDTPAFGGPDAMKASYCRVKNNNKHPVKLWRYFFFQPEFLESIGLQHPSRWPQSKKWVPLYELTLETILGNLPER